MLLVKIWQCLHCFILRKIGQENEFHPILQRKNASLEHKNSKSKKSKNWDFSMVLVKIWQCWHLLIQSKIGQESAFYDILEKKNAFLEYKNKKSEKSKNSRKKNAFLRYKNKKAKESKNWDYSMVLVKLWQWWHFLI